MPQEELDLLQLASRSMAEPSIASQIVWRQLRHADALGGLLHNVQFALKNNGDLREEIGWEDLVRALADVRDRLTAQQKQNFGVVVGNYGEGGAITILGPEYHLPPAIQLTNSGWLRGYPVPPRDTLIVVG